MTNKREETIEEYLQRIGARKRRTEKEQREIERQWWRMG
jgi:DNA-binding transcriptional regulator WhiA